jgi:hypothetical protein
MSNVKIKSHLLIGNRFLGTFFYDKDVVSRGYFKLSFANKIMGFVTGSDVMTTLPVLPKLTTPVHLELSYKFEDSLLEVEKIISGKKERAFYDVKIPISSCLFYIRIKQWQSLDVAQYPENPLVLDPSTKGDSVAIIFSFIGPNGKPFSPGYDCLMGMIDIPENPLKRFCIGIAADDGSTNPNDISVYIPLPSHKTDAL